MSEGTIKIEEIQRIVSAHFGFHPSFMRAECRARKYARPRQIAMALSREFTARSYPFIGRLFGGRDHTTALSGCRRVTALSKSDAEFGSTVARLRRLLSERDTWPAFFAAAAIANMAVDMRVARFRKIAAARKCDTALPDPMFRPFMRSELRPAP